MTGTAELNGGGGHPSVKGETLNAEVSGNGKNNGETADPGLGLAEDITRIAGADTGAAIQHAAEIRIPTDADFEAARAKLSAENNARFGQQLQDTGAEFDDLNQRIQARLGGAEQPAAATTSSVTAEPGMQTVDAAVDAERARLAPGYDRAQQIIDAQRAREQGGSDVAVGKKTRIKDRLRSVVSRRPKNEAPARVDLPAVSGGSGADDDNSMQFAFRNAGMDPENFLEDKGGSNETAVQDRSDSQPVPRVRDPNQTRVPLPGEEVFSERPDALNAAFSPVDGQKYLQGVAARVLGGEEISRKERVDFLDSMFQLEKSGVPMSNEQAAAFMSLSRERAREIRARQSANIPLTAADASFIEKYNALRPAPSEPMHDSDPPLSDEEYRKIAADEPVGQAPVFRNENDPQTTAQRERYIVGNFTRSEMSQMSEEILRGEAMSVEKRDAFMLQLQETDNWTDDESAAYMQVCKSRAEAAQAKLDAGELLNPDEMLDIPIYNGLVSGAERSAKIAQQAVDAGEGPGVATDQEQDDLDIEGRLSRLREERRRLVGEDAGEGPGVATDQDQDDLDIEGRLSRLREERRRLVGEDAGEGPGVATDQEQDNLDIERRLSRLREERRRLVGEDAGEANGILGNTDDVADRALNGEEVSQGEILEFLNDLDNRDPSGALTTKEEAAFIMLSRKDQEALQDKKDEGGVLTDDEQKRLDEYARLDAQRAESMLELADIKKRQAEGKSTPEEDRDLADYEAKNQEFPDLFPEVGVEPADATEAAAVTEESNKKINGLTAEQRAEFDALEAKKGTPEGLNKDERRRYNELRRAENDALNKETELAKLRSRANGEGNPLSDEEMERLERLENEEGENGEKLSEKELEDLGTRALEKIMKGQDASADIARFNKMWGEMRGFTLSAEQENSAREVIKGMLEKPADNGRDSGKRAKLRRKLIELGQLENQLRHREEMYKEMKKEEKMAKTEVVSSEAAYRSTLDPEQRQAKYMEFTAKTLKLSQIQQNIARMRQLGRRVKAKQLDALNYIHRTVEIGNPVRNFVDAMYANAYGGYAAVVGGIDEKFT